MQVSPSGLIVAALFYGFLWYAFERGVDYGYLQALGVIVLCLAAGWITVGVIAKSPLELLRPRRRARK